MQRHRNRTLGRILRSAAVALGIAAAGSASWTACGISATPGFDVAGVDPGPTYGVEVTIAITGSGRVTSDPTSIDCPSKCFTRIVLREAQFDGSDLGVQLTPQASVGFHFAGWSYERVELGVRARGPSQCSPMMRSTSVLPIAPGTTVLSLHYGETEGTPPAGRETECASYKRVPVAYSVTARFEENSVAPTKPPAAGPPIEVLFEPPSLGIITGREIGVTGGRVYWRFDKQGFGSGIATGPADGNGGGGSTVIVQPFDNIQAFSVAHHVALQHGSQGTSGYIQAIESGTTTVRTLTGNSSPCRAITTDATTVFCRSATGNQTYFPMYPIFGGSPVAPYVYPIPDGKDLSLDDEQFYFSEDLGGANQSFVESTSRFEDAGSPIIKKLISNQTSPHDLVAGPEYLFWFDDQSDLFTSTNTAPKGGVFAGTTRATPGAKFLALDPSSPTTFYIAITTSQTPGNSYIVKATALSSTIESFRYGLTGVGGLAVDATHVYWTQNDGRVYRAAKE